MGSKYIKNLEYSSYILDENMRVVECDDAFYRITGYTKEDIEAGKVYQNMLILDEDREEYFALVGPMLESRGELFVEHRIRRKDGSSIFVFCLGYLFKNEEGKINSKIRITDTTTMTSLRLQAEAIRHENDKQVEHLKEIAGRDELTKLYRRGAFMRRVNNAMEQEKRNTLFMLDIDDFKGVNDVYGHTVGDIVLSQVANVFKTAIRESDLVCRMGGDEFAIFIKGIDSRDYVRDIADRLIKNVKMIPVALERNIDICISIGIYIFNSENTEEDFTDIYNAADEALYIAKSNGKNQYAFSERCSEA